MKSYENVLRRNYFHRHYSSVDETYYMKYFLDRSFYDREHVTWWSAQWGFARKINSGLVAVTHKNMVVNLGLGNEATNTRDGKKWSFLKFEKFEFPLRHPDFVIHDRITDDEIFKKFFTTPYTRLKSRIHRMADKLHLGGVYSWLRRFKAK
jgi:hypothetical protein